MDELKPLLRTLEQLVSSPLKLTPSRILNTLGFTANRSEIIDRKRANEFIVRRARHNASAWTATIMVESELRRIILVFEGAHFTLDEIKTMLPVEAISSTPSLLKSGFNILFKFGSATFSAGVATETNEIGLIEVRSVK